MVNAHGVFSGHVAHDLDANTVELSAKRMVQGRWGFIQVKTALFRCFGGQNGEQSVAITHF